MDHYCSKYDGIVNTQECFTCFVKKMNKEFLRRPLCVADKSGKVIQPKIISISRIAKKARRRRA